MATKITYLIGAGASYNAHGIARNNGNKKPYANALKEFIEINLQKIKSDSLQRNLKDIANKCVEYGTPDTYAKFLYEVGDSNEYMMLKKMISIYFQNRETDINGRFSNHYIDERVLTFLTTILSDKKLPEGVNIISSVSKDPT